jgi:virginiamycin B lyase
MGKQRSQFLGFFLATFFFLVIALPADLLASGQAIIEYKMPEGISAPYALRVDSKGRVWFTEKIGRKLVMFDPESASFDEHPLPKSWHGIGPSRIAVAPNGDVWFTVRRWAEEVAPTNLLGRFGVGDGKSGFEQFMLPDGVIPEALVVDKNGGVWFLNPEQNQICNFTGKPLRSKCHTVPTINSYPREITLDGRGGVWFSEGNVDRITRFDPTTGQFEEHDVPTRFASVGALTADDGGRIWFAEMTSNRIGAYYPDLKRFDEVDIPTGAGLPTGIVSDDKGRIWFLEYRGNKVGMFDPVAAVFKEFDIPTFNSQPGEIAMDRQRGRVWFSESGTEAKKLGLLNIATALSQTETIGPKAVKEKKLIDRAKQEWNILHLLLALLVLVMAGGLIKWVTKKKAA